MVKRFIICCDGTWNSSDTGGESNPSNVANLSRMIARQGVNNQTGQPIEQIVYYQTGVGTGPTESLAGKMASTIEGMTGSGLEEHVLQAYHFVATNWQYGDEVLLFGFSRGAYTARAVGGLLTQMGLLKPVDLKFFNSIYTCYKEQGDKINYTRCKPDGERDQEQVDAEQKAAEKKAAEEKIAGSSAETSGSQTKPGVVKHVHVDNGFAWDDPKAKNIYTKWTVCHGLREQPKSYWESAKSLVGGSTEKIPLEKIILEAQPKKITLEVIGVWDTVGALGIPQSVVSSVTGVNKGKDFADTALNKRVLRAYQALALDEHRGAFGPSLWYLKGDPKASEEEDLSQIVDLRQCWFPGHHSDIGGGVSSMSKDMTKKFADNADAYKLDQVSLAWMCDQIDGLVTFHRLNSDVFLPKAPTKATQLEKWTARMSDDPIKWYYKSNTGGGSIIRTPGTYSRIDLDPKKLKDKNSDVVQHTRERMHPSVKLLQDATNVKSDALAETRSWSLYGIKKSQVLTEEWKYVVNAGGKGAKWTRAEVVGSAATRLWSEVPGVRALELDEHVIKPGGYEDRLLNDTARKLLEERNAVRIEEIKKLEEKKKSEEKEKLVAATGGTPFVATERCHAEWWFKVECNGVHTARDFTEKI